MVNGTLLDDSTLLSDGSAYLFNTTGLSSSSVSPVDAFSIATSFHTIGVESINVQSLVPKFFVVARYDFTFGQTWN